jgi:hypothetical protein
MWHNKSYLFVMLKFFAALFYRLMRNIDDILNFYFSGFVNFEVIYLNIY